jgi:hypothetical protein
MRSSLLIFLFVHLVVSLSAQQSSGDLHRFDDVALLFSYLEIEYGIQLNYASQQFSEGKYVIENKRDNVADLLDELAEKNDWELERLGNKRFLIRPKTQEQDRLEKSIEYRISIIDEETSLPLSYVAVSIDGSGIGGYTDHQGDIHLEVPMSVSESESTLLIQMLGYQSQRISMQLVGGQRTIRMKPSPLGLEEVIIEDRMDPVQVKPESESIRIQNSDGIGLVSGLTGNDVLKQAQLLPGLSAHDDSSSGLSIRGDESNQTLIMLDGIPIYNASHYYGIFSSINSTFVSSMDLYKNNLPIQYGGKTSGMLNINSPDMSRLAGVQVKGDINLLTSSLGAEFPIGKNAALFVSGRTTYRNVNQTDFFDLFSDDTEEQVTQNFSLLSREKLLNSVPDYKFYDLNVKFQIAPTSNHQIDVNFYRSNDDLNDGLENEFSTRRQGVRIVNRESYLNEEQWSNLGFSINSNLELGQKTEIISSAFYSNYGNEGILGTSLFRRVGTEVTRFQFKNDRLNEIRDFGVRSFLRTELGDQSGQSIEAGFEIQHHNTSLNIDEAARSILGIQQESIELSAFASYNIVTKNGFGLNAGIRSSYYEGLEKLYYSPRLYLYQKLGEHFTWKGSYGRHYQFVRELSFETLLGRTINFWALSNDQLPVSASDKFMTGFTARAGRLKLDIEAYFKAQDNVIEFALLRSPYNGNNVIPVSQGNGNGYIPYQGEGTTRGVDFLLSYTARSYTGWLSYSLSESTQSFRRILRGRDFPSPEDRRHQFKWVNQWNISEFTFNANFIFSSGRPYTDISILSANLSRDELRPMDRVNRLPAYSRFDIGVSYDFSFEGLDASIGISAFNLVDRMNVKYIQYIFSVPSNTAQDQMKIINTVIGAEANLLPRTFNVNFSLKY